MLSKLFKKKKVYVDVSMIQLILRDFISDIKNNVIVYILVDDDGKVTLHTNRPGVFIGYQGKDIDELKTKILECGATSVYLKDMTYFISNCNM